MEIEPEVVISYSHDCQEHIEKVMALNNFIRDNGYDCYIDQSFKQTYTSIDFNEMMIKMIPISNKVIIVLTPEYKRKAEKFEGGVGKEYRIINDEIDKIDNKYILVTFISLSLISVDEILPHGLNGREIIDLEQDERDDFKRLFSKLSDKPIYSISPVSKNKTTIDPISLPPFSLQNNSNLISKKYLFNKIQPFLLENKQLLNGFGPNSLIAINNPLSDSINTWNDVKKATIIPNNNKIINLIEKNLVLLSLPEKELFYKFKTHAIAFEKNQNNRSDSYAVPIFPSEFEKMIFMEV